MHRLIRVSFALFLAIPLSSCSVFMAASSNENPDLSVLKAGTPRKRVEQVFTNIIEEGGSRGERRVTYQFYTEDDASIGRAAVYGVLDIATLGLAEIATTPIEALQGKKHLVTVTYDGESRVTRVKQRVEDAPLPKPERALGLEDEQPGLTPAAAASDGKAPQATLPDARARQL